MGSLRWIGTKFAASVRFSIFLLTATLMFAIAPTYAQAAPESRNYSSSDIYAGQTLYTGQIIVSDNRLYELQLQNDGNLVLYARTYDGWGNIVNRTALWASNTAGRTVSRCVMQSDGNLVLYYDYYAYNYWGRYWQMYSQPVWASNTSGNPGAYLELQNDGNLVIYVNPGANNSAYDYAIWATGTNR